MKLIKSSTYRALKADQHNLSVVIAENWKLKKMLSSTGDKVMTISQELNAAKKQLARYKRQRGAGGKFVKDKRQQE